MAKDRTRHARRREPKRVDTALITRVNQDIITRVSQDISGVVISMSQDLCSSLVDINDAIMDFMESYRRLTDENHL